MTMLCRQPIWKAAWLLGNKWTVTAMVLRTVRGVADFCRVSVATFGYVVNIQKLQGTLCSFNCTAAGQTAHQERYLLRNTITRSCRAPPACRPHPTEAIANAEGGDQSPLSPLTTTNPEPMAALHPRPTWTDTASQDRATTIV